MYKSLLNPGSIFGVVSPGFDDGRHSLWHGLMERIKVLRGDMSPNLKRNSFQNFIISDLNELCKATISKQIKLQGPGWFRSLTNSKLFMKLP